MRVGEALPFSRAGLLVEDPGYLSLSRCATGESIASLRIGLD